MSDAIASPTDTVLAVRKRPGMYVGDTDAYGIGHLARFAAERLLVTCDGRTPSVLEVCLGADNSFSARVDGFAVNSSAAAVLLARVGGCACPKKECSRPDTIDLGILSALSQRLELDVWEGGQLRRCVASQGVVVSPWHNVDDAESGPGGSASSTKLRFWPDRSIFTATAAFPAKLLQHRMRDLAAFRPGLEARWVDTTRGESCTYRYPDGLAGYVRERARGPGLPEGALLASATLAPYDLRCALLWRPGALSGTHLFSFANDTPTPKGGQHVRVFREAVAGVLTRIAQRSGSTRHVSADAAAAGLVAAIQVQADPRRIRFAGCIKDELDAPDLLGIRPVLEDALERALVAQPAVSDTLLSHLLKSRR